MRKDISVVNLIMIITITLLLIMTGILSLLAYHSLTVVIDRAQEKLYHERSENIYSVLKGKSDRLERTGMPDVYRKDFQKQVLKEIDKVYGDNSVGKPFIIKDDGTYLYPFNDTGKIEGNILKSISNRSSNSFYYRDRNKKRWIHSLYFEPWEWYICFTVPLDIKYADRRLFFVKFIPIIAICAGIIMFLTAFILKKIMLPVIELTSASAAIAGGKLDINISPKGIGELAKLADNFSQMQEAIRDKINELKEQELNLRTTLNSINDCIIVIDHKGIITRVNNSTKKLLKIDSSIGQNVEQVLQIEQAYGKDIFSLKKAIEDERLYRFGSDTYLHLSKNNQVPISGSCSPIKDDNDNFIGMVIVFRDISEEIQLRDQLHQSQKMDAIGQLAGGVAHDFNNMLAGIISAAEMLKEENISEQNIECLDVILNASERAGYLIRQLLAFSRKGAKASSTICVETIINETIALLERTLDKSIRIEFKNEATVTEVIGDNSILQNAFMNISINASHAMPKGGVLSFTLTNRELDEKYCNASTFEIEPGEYVHIAIEDNGCGMSLDVQSRIFEPFFTTKEQGKGTGLGLAAVYGMVQEHDGAITVNSTLGEGTIFDIYLPVSHKKVKEMGVSEETKKGVGTILVIDDEEIIRITAQLILSSLGYDVILAEDGLKGLEVFKTRQDEIDLIILDMIMPVMSGREALNEIKMIDNNIPILIASGFAKEEDIDELMKQNINGFLKKPYRKAQLSDAVNKILG